MQSEKFFYSIHKIKICILFLLLVTRPIGVAWANTHVLSLDGGYDEESNYPRHYFAVQSAVNTARKHDWNSHILAKSGEWKIKDPNSGTVFSPPSPLPIQGPLKTIDDIKKEIKMMAPKEKDTLMIQITNHGLSSRTTDPMDGMFAAWGKTTISWKQLQEAISSIRQELGHSFKVKIVTTTCFGGGVHGIARNLPDVCTVSASNHRFPTDASGVTADKPDAPFSHSFWASLQAKNTFAQSSADALKAYVEGGAVVPPEHLGGTSSSDYLNFELGEYPYPIASPRYVAPDFTWAMLERHFRRKCSEPLSHEIHYCSQSLPIEEATQKLIGSLSLVDASTQSDGIDQLLKLLPPPFQNLTSHNFCAFEPSKKWQEKAEEIRLDLDKQIEKNNIELQLISTQADAEENKYLAVLELKTAEIDSQEKKELEKLTLQKDLNDDDRKEKEEAISEKFENEREELSNKIEVEKFQNEKILKKARLKMRLEQLKEDKKELSEKNIYYPHPEMYNENILLNLISKINRLKTKGEDALKKYKQLLACEAESL